MVEDQYYIVAPPSSADERTRILKHDDTFAVFDQHGDILSDGPSEQGLYHLGTRFLSRYVLTLFNHRPLLLGSTIRDDNGLLAVDLTNPDVYVGGRVVVPRGALHLFRAKFLWCGACYESIRLWNYARDPIDLSLAFEYQADFADVFEVRGLKRAQRGRTLPVQIEPHGALLGYEGRDGVIRRTRVEYSSSTSVVPRDVAASGLRLRVRLAPQEETTLTVRAACEMDKTVSDTEDFDAALSAASARREHAQARRCGFATANEPFNGWVKRSLSDLQMMITETPHGPYPYAGVPWFSTPFGRDGIITALELLWVDPQLARGVLAYLAATQATEVHQQSEAEPGKILHEIRTGEMAALKEIPFGRYYGSVDATPLFVVLAAAYFERTADRSLIDTLWPHIESAVRWIDEHGDFDGDGFVEYLQRSPKGLLHQGWKDSQDAIFHADGSPADGPIALCEVQGYVYAAKMGAADLAQTLGRTDLAERWRRSAEELKTAFARAYWCEELSTYALALDGEKQACRVRTSNAGQCLWTGIAQDEHARRVARTIMSPESFSGWGVRTVAASEPRYNPMSYHNGSVWPHDTALIAQGLARYGFKTEAVELLSGMFDASSVVDLRRIPELFCGFTRRSGRGPTLYPVACSPQSWAAGAVFMLLSAALGLSIRAAGNEIRFSRPALPPWLQGLTLTHLSLGPGWADVSLTRTAEGVHAALLKQEGGVRVTTVP